MRMKTLVVLSVVALLAGGATGGGYAFMSQKGDLSPSQEQIAVQPALTEEEKNEALLDNFIAEQEEEHPDGLTESKIAVGSKYDGITYNNVTPASTSKSNVSNVSTSSGTQEKTDNKTTESGVWETTSGEQQVGVVDISSSSALNIRNKPNMEGEITGKLYKDNEVLVVGKEGNWYQIVTSDGTEGYVSADYLKINS